MSPFALSKDSSTLKAILGLKPIEGVIQVT